MSTIDGRAALSRFDRSLAAARRALADAIESEKDADRELARIRQAQAAAYTALADLQLDHAGSDDRLRMLRALDAEVDRLLGEQEGYVADLLRDLNAKATQIATLEQTRQKAAADLDAAVEAFEAIVAEVEAALETDEAYHACVEAAAEAEAITERARQKLEMAEEDRAEKGKPYEADPLFMYLWKQGFRTTDYRAPPPVRFLDGWVASVCRYDRSWRNYQRLTELPGRIAAHVERMAAVEAEAQEALETAETEALAAAGAEALKAGVEAARTALEAIDARIEAAEAAHLALARTHAEAEAGARGPAHEARIRLAEALKQASFPDLRLLVTQTVTPDDDRMVDQLVTLRRQEMDEEMRRSEVAAAPKRRRLRLEELEHFRRLFKRDQLDSPYAYFSASAIDSVMDALLAGRLMPEDAVRTLRRKVRRRQPRAHPGFGGPSRRKTSGFPEIARDIGWGILREMGRSSRRGGSPIGLPGSLPGGLPGGFPGSRRSGRSVSLPSRRPRIGGGRSGGFRTGGGF